MDVSFAPSPTLAPQPVTPTAPLAVPADPVDPNETPSVFSPVAAIQRFEHVVIDTVAAILPPHLLSTEEIERRLGAVYRRLGLPEGRLELMTGIRERRFFEPGTRPGSISALAVREAIAASGIAIEMFGALIHGSVCRDQMEPATAAGVHEEAGLPPHCQFFDVSNACLGLLCAVMILAMMVELGQIKAGIAVGTEVGGPLVHQTIEQLNAASEAGELTRKSIKPQLASLTIGSGSSAIIVAHRDLSPDGSSLLGTATRTDTASSRLCAGGSEAGGPTLMQTDSEALLHAGVNLASETWGQFAPAFRRHGGRTDRICTHQVGVRHRKLLLETLGLDPSLDFPTVERFGNTGSCALPMAAALAGEAGHLQPGDRAAWLGIGSGLSSQMVAVDWNATNAVVHDLRTPLVT